MEQITLKSGKVILATLARVYQAFEGETRYIFMDQNGYEYRCIKDEHGNYVEKKI